MSKVYEIAFKMGGELTGTFAKSMRGANAALTDLQKQMRKIGGESSSIENLQSLQKSVGKLSREYTEAQANVKRLAQANDQLVNVKKQLEGIDSETKSINAMQKLQKRVGDLARDYHQAQEKAQGLAKAIQASEKPTRAQESRFKMARNAAAKLKDELIAQRAALQDAKQTSDLAGKSYQQLEKRKKDLAAEAEKLQAVQEELKTSTKNNSAEFKRAQTAAAKLKSKLGEQRAELSRVRHASDLTGKSYEELARRQKELTAQTKRLEGAQASLQKTMSKQQAIRAQRDNLRGQMLDAVALAGSMAAPIKLAADWEQSLAELNKVANGTPAQIAAISKEAQRLSVNTGVAREQIIGAYTAAAQAGFNQDEWAQFAEVSAKMGVAFDITGDQAGEMLKKWRDGMKLTMGEAEQLAAAANHLSNNMSATAAGIGDVLIRQGAVFKTAGIDQATGASLAAALVATAPSEEIAATAGKNFVLALTQGMAATKTQKNTLDMLGFDAQDLAAQMQQAPREAIQSVLMAIRDIDPEERTGVIANLFGKESIGGIAPLIDNLENLQKAFALTGDSAKYASSLQDEFNALQSTTNQQAKKAMEGLKALGTGIGGVLLPPINAFLETAAPMALKLAELAQQFPLITKTVVGLTAGMVALKVASIAGGYAWTFVAGAGLQVKRVIDTLRVAYLLNTGAVSANTTASKASIVASKGMAAASRTAAVAQSLFNAALLANPIGLVIAGIVAGVAALVAAGVAIYRNWAVIKSFLSGFWDGFKSGIQPVIDAFAPLRAAMAPVGKAFGWLWQQVKALIGWFGNLFTPVKHSEETLKSAASAGQTFGNIIGTVFRVATFPITMFVKAIGGVLDAFTVAKNWIASFSLSDAVGGVVNGAKWAFMNLTPLGWTMQAFSKAKTWLSSFSLTSVANSIVVGVKTAFNLLNPVNWVRGAFNLAKAFLSAFGLGNEASAIISKVKTVFAGMLNPLQWVRNAFNLVTNWLSGFSLYNSGKKIISTLSSGVMSRAKELVNSVKGIFKKVRDYLPFSDAKVGPFSDLTKSGSAIISTLAAGVDTNATLENALAQKMLAGKSELNTQMESAKANIIAHVQPSDAVNVNPIFNPQAPNVNVNAQTPSVINKINANAQTPSVNNIIKNIMPSMDLSGLYKLASSAFNLPLDALRSVSQPAQVLPQENNSIVNRVKNMGDSVSQTGNHYTITVEQNINVSGGGSSAEVRQAALDGAREGAESLSDKLGQLMADQRRVSYG